MLNTLTCPCSSCAKLTGQCIQRIRRSLDPPSEALKASIAQRPLVRRSLNKATAKKLEGMIEVEARHEAAHPERNMASLIGSLFALEAFDYARQGAEGDTSYALRCVISAYPIEDLQRWMD